MARLRHPHRNPPRRRPPRRRDPDPHPRRLGRDRRLAHPLAHHAARLRPLARPIFGLTRPRQPILGTECAGTVAAIGPGVTTFREGDAVIAYLGARMGAHAELTRARADKAVILKPETLTWEQAAAFSFGGATALTYLRDGGNLKPGQSSSSSAPRAASATPRSRSLPPWAHVTTVTSGRQHPPRGPPRHTDARLWRDRHRHAP